MEFSEHFFEEECRCNFTIPVMMKRAWAAQIELLEIIDHICKKHGITYYADWGTLLGTIRHKGFIPWDDDIDIAMKRADYNRFISIAHKELPKGIFCHSIYTEQEYKELFARVVNSHQVNFKEEHLKRWHGCPYIVGVDIFPLDKLPVDEEEKGLHRNLLDVSLKALQAFLIKSENWESYIMQMESMCGISFDYTKKLENQILRVIDGILQMYDEDGGSYTEIAAYKDYKDYHIPLECYEEIIWLPFEGIRMPIPKEYDIILTTMYGNYKTPVKSLTRDYPFYKKQQEIVDKVMSQKN